MTYSFDAAHMLGDGRGSGALARVDDNSPSLSAANENAVLSPPTFSERERHIVLMIAYNDTAFVSANVSRYWDPKNRRCSDEFKTRAADALIERLRYDVSETLAFSHDRVRGVQEAFGLLGIAFTEAHRDSVSHALYGHIQLENKDPVGTLERIRHTVERMTHGMKNPETLVNFRRDYYTHETRRAPVTAGHDPAL